MFKIEINYLKTSLQIVLLSKFEYIHKKNACWIDELPVAIVIAVVIGGSGGSHLRNLVLRMSSAGAVCRAAFRKIGNESMKQSR